MNIFLLFLKGIAIGMVNIIPGVSGGTLAVVFGIYNEFVNAITLNFKKLWANKKFVFPLLGGMLLGILIFSKVIGILYEKFPIQTDYFFTGLVLGSLPMIFSLTIKNYHTQKDENQKNQNDDKNTSEKLSVRTIISIVISILVGFAVIIFFTILQKRFDATQITSAMLEITFSLEFRIFIAGILGAIAMIIPGISGSLIMLMMGVYPIIVTCIPALFEPSKFLHALFLLLPNGVGVIIGLLCGAKLISFLFKKFPNATYGCIFGLIFGSIFAVFPGFKGFSSVLSIIVSIICIIAGFSMAFFCSKIDDKSKNKNAKEKVEEN